MENRLNPEPWEPENYKEASFADLLCICRDRGVGDAKFRRWTNADLAREAKLGKRIIAYYIAGESWPRGKADLENLLGILTRPEVVLYDAFCESARHVLGLEAAEDDHDPQPLDQVLQAALDRRLGFQSDEPDGVWPLSANTGLKVDRIEAFLDGTIPDREEISALTQAFGRNRIAAESRILSALRESWHRRARQKPKPSADPDRRHSDAWPGPITLMTTIIALAIVGTAALNGGLNTWFVAGGTFALLFAWFFEVSLRTASNRDAVAAFFENEGYAEAYKSGLSMVLDKTDSWLLKKRLRAAGRKTPTLKTSVPWAWPVRLYAFAILVASLYPMTMMFWQWISTDAHVMFGNSHLLLSTTYIFFKILPVAVYLGSFAAAICASQRHWTRRWAWMVLAIALAFVGLGLLAFFPSPINGLNYYWNGSLGTMATGVLIAFALICYFRVVAVVLGPAAAAGFGGFIIAFGSNWIDNLAQHFAAEWGGSKDIWFDWISSLCNATASILVAVPLVILLKRTITRPGLAAPLCYALLTVATVAMLSYGAGLLNDWRAYYIYIGLIPIVNAMFDYFSLGLTRWALRSGLRKVGIQTLAYSALDLFAAMLIFLALGAFCIFVFHAVNELAASVQGSGTQVIPLNPADGGSIFEGISDAPVQHTWLYLTFLTTLLPTLVHASVAVWAIGPAIMGMQARAKIVEHFRFASATLPSDVGYVALLVAWSTFAVLAPIALIVWVATSLSAESCELGYMLLNFFITVLHLFIDNPEVIPVFDIATECRLEPTVELWTNPETWTN